MRFLMIFSFLLSFVAAQAQHTDSATVDDIVAGRETKRDEQAEYVRRHWVTTHDTVRVLVVRVIDGDTFECVTCATCSDRIRIRVLNLDTFEKAKIPRAYKQAAALGTTIKKIVLAGKTCNSRGGNHAVRRVGYAASGKLPSYER
jgi:endonuclease YncB( thermonuclease family)